jgi:nitrite reductase/ring-hydroxylating ferredoxin subunit
MYRGSPQVRRSCRSRELLQEVHMAGQQDTKKGPDLSLGVPVAEIPESGLLAAHVGDEAVLLARAGEEYFAIGASCPHYSGPLAGGLIVGDTVRCPWHHACISLRTGEAVRAPAFDPVAPWKVERRATSSSERGRRKRARRSPPSSPARPVHRGS